MLTLMHLIKAQIFTLRLIRRAAEEECEVPNVASLSRFMSYLPLLSFGPSAIVSGSA